MMPFASLWRKMPKTWPPLKNVPRSRISPSSPSFRIFAGVARYSLLIKPSAVNEIEKISSKKDRQRIVRKIEELAENPLPPGSRKLSGRDRYRLRQGVFRILYELRNSELIVCVVKIGHRKEVYGRSR